MATLDERVEILEKRTDDFDEKIKKLEDELSSIKESLQWNIKD